MMDSILTENNISFKELEQKIFKYICELGCEIPKEILEAYDEELTKSREKGKYLNKGKRKTSIKTVYRIKEIVEPLSAAKAPKKDGKGNPYIDLYGSHVPLRDFALTASRKALLKIFD